MQFRIRHIQTPFRMQPGLSRPLAPVQHWTRLLRAADAPALLAEKLGVLRRDPQGAWLAQDATEAWRALDTVIDSAARACPQAVRRDGRHLVVPDIAVTLHMDPQRPELHADPQADPAIVDALRALPGWQRVAAALALVLHEDWALLRDDGHVPVLAVCTPSRWSPAQKVGQHFRDIHAPVADNRLIVGAADALVRLTTGTDPWQRHVWTLTPSSSFDQHPDRTPPASWDPRAAPATLLRQAWLRVEHQTFLPMPAQDGQPAGAIFTIRVERAPLTDLLLEARDARHLRDALASMSPAVLAYRGLTDARDRLLDALDAWGPGPATAAPHLASDPPTPGAGA